MYCWLPNRGLVADMLLILANGRFTIPVATLRRLSGAVLWGQHQPKPLIQHPRGHRIGANLHRECTALARHHPTSHSPWLRKNPCSRYERGHACSRGASPLAMSTGQQVHPDALLAPSPFASNALNSPRRLCFSLSPPLHVPLLISLLN